jgi:hypothetical protein
MNENTGYFRFHGDEFSLRCAIEHQKESKNVIFLGDGCNDMDCRRILSRKKVCAC